MLPENMALPAQQAVSQDARWSLPRNCPHAGRPAHGRLSGGRDCFWSQFLVLRQIHWASGFVLDLKEWPRILWVPMCLDLLPLPVVSLLPGSSAPSLLLLFLMHWESHHMLPCCFVSISVKVYALKCVTMIDSLMGCNHWSNLTLPVSLLIVSDLH